MEKNVVNKKSVKNTKSKLAHYTLSVLTVGGMAGAVILPVDVAYAAEEQLQVESQILGEDQDDKKRKNKAITTQDLPPWLQKSHETPFTVNGGVENIHLTSVSLPNCSLGGYCSAWIGKEDGEKGVTYKLVEGKLPPGVDMDDRGRILGHPQRIGSYTFSVQRYEGPLATDATTYSFSVGYGEVEVGGYYDKNGIDWPPSFRGKVVSAIAAGVEHSLAIVDGQVVAWGHKDQHQLDVPSNVTDVTAIAAGDYHSLALKKDGTVVAWGKNNDRESTVPTALEDVTAIAGGDGYSLALKKDGTVVAWGRNNLHQTEIPQGLTDVIAISAGGGHSLALKKDGTVVAWGLNDQRQAEIPGDLTDVTAIAAGGAHSLALKKDGNVVAWGRNIENQTTVPGNYAGRVAAIAAGENHSLLIGEDGRAVGWGSTRYSKDAGFTARAFVTAISARGSQSMVIVVNVRPPVINTTSLENPTIGQEYRTQLDVRGEVASCEVTKGALGYGLGMEKNDKGCIIYGTPDKRNLTKDMGYGPGKFRFEITVESPYGLKDTKEYVFEYKATAPTINTTTLPSAWVGKEYLVELDVSGSFNTCEIVEGALGYGFSLGVNEKGRCEIQGISDLKNLLEKDGAVRQFKLKVTDKDTDLSDTREFTLLHLPSAGMPIIRTAELPDPVIGVPYEAIIEVDGDFTGDSQLKCTVEGISQFSFDEKKCKISGTPTKPEKGSLKVTATNKYGVYTQNIDYNVIVAKPIITTSSLSNPIQGQEYKAQITTEGSPVTSFKVLSGKLPDGMTLSESTGLITGIPAAGGVFTFSIQASNDGGQDQRSYTLNITDSEPKFDPDQKLKAAVIGQEYEEQLKATGGSTLTFSKVDGQLPAGITLNPDGTLTGIPAQKSSFTFKAKVTNGVKEDLQQFTFVVGMKPQISAVNVSNGKYGTSYEALIEASGYPAPEFTVTGLPPGLTVDPSSGRISGTPQSAGVFNLHAEASNIAGSSGVDRRIVITPTDVSSTTDAFYYQIVWGMEEGIITDGLKEGKFRPLDRTTRAEMMTFLYHLVNPQDYTPPPQSRFKDVPVDHKNYQEISWAVDKGIATGNDNGTFLPEGDVSQADNAVLLYHLYRLEGGSEYTPSEQSPFKDVSTSHKNYREISWLQDRDINTGYSDKTFHPTASVNRESIMAFLYRYQHHR